MPKLKSLRAQVGAYGRVAAGGIVEVDENTARKLLDTRKFVRASEEDIAAAQGRMKDYVKGTAVFGQRVGFTPIAQKPEAAKSADEKALTAKNVEAQAKAAAKAAEDQAKADAAAKPADEQAKADAAAKAADEQAKADAGDKGQKAAK